ncbi:fatty acyl-AMP ligase [Roseovarius sp. D22-M7]|uniref:fatty acyl-AMP ligase n=1 Tax=Roseovarius sp. D22-M7 TaxID=3127116 RepID=UPI00300F871A
MNATSSSHHVALRKADFSTLCDALDYAAEGETGVNFFDARGALYSTTSYRDLREQAIELAHRLVGLGIAPGGRVALVAETSPHFVRFFWACQYAGLVPVPLPAAVHIGGHATYVAQLRQLLQNCEASAAMAPVEWLDFLKEATTDLDLALVGAPEDFDRLDPSPATLPGVTPDSTAYIQYTSGSTRFPRGVVIDQKTVLANVRDMAINGLKLTNEDRFGSWLPFFHDMGLVAFIIMPMATQRSVDFLGTHDFAMRPRKWLEMMSNNSTTITSAPPFAYELSVMRVRPHDAEKLDLSALRVACVGAEMISPEPLDRFAEALAPAGFSPDAFLPCYGMAECSLAISFAPLDTPLVVDHVDSEQMQSAGFAKAVDPEAARREDRHVTRYVDCGKLLPSFEVSIRDESGRPLSDRQAGVIHLRGPSVMSAYFNDAETTRETLSDDGWLDTGDIGYLVDGHLFVTGRKKDMMIIHGRNIWPQDLEYVAKTQPGVHYNDVAAFSVPAKDTHKETAVLVVQCRERNEIKRAGLVKTITAMVRSEFGIDCHVELVPTRTLPRTSSGKLARARARLDHLARKHGSSVQNLPENVQNVRDPRDDVPMRYSA